MPSNNNNTNKKRPTGAVPKNKPNNTTKVIDDEMDMDASTIHDGNKSTADSNEKVILVCKHMLKMKHGSSVRPSVSSRVQKMYSRIYKIARLFGIAYIL